MVTETDLVPVEEGHVIRLGEARPQGTIELATSMANALADIVEQRQLYVVIGKNQDGSPRKFPTVEAWMTIARMDNVVAREMRDGVAQHDDGAFEAQVELVRLSDGMVIGHGSAECGGPDDKDRWGKADWSKRPAFQRRSMAVTRATSRAFRQQYAWVMKLAGYEPTPAEEMADDQRPVGSYDTPPDRPQLERKADGLIGTAEVGKARDSDFELRQTPDGWTLGFKLKSNGGGFKVLTRDELALQLLDAKAEVVGKRITVWGRVRDETFTPKGSGRPVVYQVIDAERIKTEAGVLPVMPKREDPAPYGAGGQDAPEDDVIPVVEGQEELPFDPAESARLDAEEAMA